MKLGKEVKVKDLIKALKTLNPESDVKLTVASVFSPLDWHVFDGALIEERPDKKTSYIFINKTYDDVR